MHLANDIKWHKPSLLTVIPKITVLRYFSDEKKWPHKFIETLCASAHAVLCIYYSIIGPKEAPQREQTEWTVTVPPSIYLEISTQKINELLEHKQICAADVRCLDSASKHCLMQLFLENCLSEK